MSKNLDISYNCVLNESEILYKLFIIWQLTFCPFKMTVTLFPFVHAKINATE